MSYNVSRNKRAGKIRKRQKQFERMPKLAHLSAACLTLFLSACASGGKDTLPDPATRDRVVSESSAPAFGNATTILGGGQVDENAPPVRQPEDVIVRGTGLFVRDADSAQETDAPGEVTLNFVDAEIADVVRAVLRDTLNLNYTIDPQVRGRMTLQTATPIARDDILATLEGALELNDVALVQSPGGIYAVMPISAAQNLSGAPRLEGAGLGFGQQIVQLRYISANDMQEILSAVAPEGGVVHADQARNLLILSGTRQETQTLIDTIKLFDVNYLKGASYGVFTLTNVRVNTLVDELEQVFEDSPVDGLVKLIPLERINAVLAIAREPDLLTDVRAWIRRLDVEGDGPNRRIYLYHAQNAKAVDLAQTLNMLFGLNSDAAASPISLDATGQGADPAGGSAQDASGSSAGLMTVSSGGMRIIADQKQNLLLLFATHREYRLIEDALTRIDFAPNQVLIEATIAEVMLTDEFNLGIRWSFEGNDGSVTFSDSAAGAVVSSFPGLSAAFMESDVNVVLNALADRTDVKVISSPKIVVLDNQPALLEVGDEVPVAIQSAVTTIDPEAPIVNAIEFRQTGVILQVTPRINNSGLVILEITQEVSDVIATTTSDIDSPTIQQRRFASTVAVQSGATVALGGLIRNNVSQGRAGVPFLKDIPGVGALFRTTDNETRRTELLIFLTPRIVRNPAEALAMTEYLREQLSGADFTSIEDDPWAGLK